MKDTNETHVTTTDAQTGRRLRVAKWSGALAGGAMLGRALLFGCCGSCFVRGTRIATPKGPRPIEDLVIGDTVFSYDTVRAVIVERPVVDVLRSKSREILSVRADEQVIAGVTGEHPFWDTISATWIPAAQLALGHSLLGWLGQGSTKAIPVSELRRERTYAEVDVFNLTVGGGEEHNYFAEGLLVHNKALQREPVDAGQPVDSASADGST